MRNMDRVNADADEPLLARLSSYRETTVAGLLSAVPDRDPKPYLYGPLAAHLSRVGKSIRPALCLATCRALPCTSRLPPWRPPQSIGFISIGSMLRLCSAPSKESKA